ncbi:MAG: IS21 family transposase [Acidobacteriia bacterium]|nr:IS21 family transposase [Terriglobia bacterium]
MKRLSMRKLKEVLRLRYELGLGQRQIARSCSIAQGTVSGYLKRAETAGVSWPLPEGWNDRQLEAALFGGTPRRAYETRKPQPDFAQLGEKLFVDYAGATIPVHDPQGGPERQASIFVAVLGASNYTYAEATESQELEHWIGSHIRAFEFLGGVPKLVIPDNTRTGVSRACRYEPDLNRTYHELAMHYGVGVLPTRPYKPRDKAKVETGVQIVQRWIVAALRHRKFFSLAELNQAIRELLDKLNQRPFRQRPGCRASLFQELDRPALGPLPRERFELQQWATARLNIDYHVEIDRHYYSVPYVLTGQVVEIRSTLSTVEIFHRGERVASHVRSHLPYKATTVNEHRPKSHQQHLAWPPSRLLHWAQSVGPSTAQLFKAILESKPHPEMGYRSCLGILRLGQRYSTERVEAAAARALATGACSYQSVKSMLERGLDRQPLEAPAPRPPLEHDNLRGAAYFDPSDTPRLL